MLLSMYFYRAFIVAPPLVLFLLFILAGGWGYALAVARRIATEQDKRYATEAIFCLGDWKDFGSDDSRFDGGMTQG